MSRSVSMNPSGSRRKVQVSPRFDKTLAAYMLTAGAAGVGLLASAVPAHAKVVYTAADQQIEPNTGLSLDLTNHGITNFVFSNYYSSTSSLLNLSIAPVNAGNEIFSTGGNVFSAFAAAIPAGVEIGPDGKFKKRSGDEMADSESTRPICRGPWVHANERYLGLKFVINGEFHFGWARLDVNCDYPHPINARLTGYAYETIPNQPIVTGDTQETNVSDRGSLGNLARGAAVLSNGRDGQTSDEIH